MPIAGGLSALEVIKQYDAIQNNLCLLTY